MKIVKVKDYQEMSEWASKQVIDKIKASDQFVLGLATGSTPEGLYQNLIDAYKEQEVSFKNVITFNLDEYIGLGADNPNSYRYFMDEKLFNHIDIDPKHAHLPNGVATDIEQECKDYEALIKETGEIDLQILGLGVNGHIGFNEPGTSFSSRTQMTDLVEATIEANSRFFDHKEDVPTQAITMGIKSIMESNEIILLASGENKAEAVKQLVEGEVTEDFPASVLQKHPQVTIVIDEAAASLLK
ncbi:glucosamine-6-phosphate deaminase [Amphibacillus sp. Q70]|uniref:glucosamine-6-phosphate deaminase n=1 Tax=Amphibacillus sp. Q70 TaxID=3453416 RepID=UPI003F8416AC